MSSQSPLDFARIKDEDISLVSTDEAFDIIDLFESSMNSSPGPDVDGKATRIFTEIRKMAPQDPQSEQWHKFLANAWQGIIRIASCIPPDHYGQDVILALVSHLKDVGPVSEPLPGLGISMRESWNHTPSFGTHVDNDDDREFTLPEWLNLNSFVAKLHGTQIAEFDTCATWEMRCGLEDDDKVPSPVFDTRVRVACEWILRSGDLILEQSLLNINDAAPQENHGDSYRTGPLFPGTRGFNLERWGWWKRRLVAVRKEVDESVHAAIDEAVRKMTQSEMDVASKIAAAARPATNGVS